MALIVANMETEIKKITDEKFLLFDEFPEDTIEVADRWSSAVDVYGSVVIPSSTTANQAKEAFKKLMLGITLGTALPIFVSAFTAYTAALAAGMAPSFTGVPPPVPIILAPVFEIGNAGGSAEDVAKAMAQVIDIYFRTGTAIPVPSGSPIIWS